MRLIVLLLIGLSLAGCDRQKAAAPQDDSPAAQGAGLDRSHAGTPAPAVRFTDAAGTAMTLADRRGAPVLVNLWASWCAPCIKELPSLDAAAAAEGAPAIVALSQDMAPLASVNAFWDQRKLATLKPYHDDQMAFSGAIGAQILPTTILYGADGREVWRYVGDRDWSDAESRALLGEAR